MADSPLGYHLEGPVARLHFDDGKANAVSHDAVDAFHRALDRAEKEAGAVLLLGRTGRFCAGFDLNTMGAGPEAARGLVAAGAELLLRMTEAPLPIVAACGGHALAMGALLLLASDLRVGAEGDFKIGLNEVAIRMTLPVFAVELARERLSRRHLVRAAVLAEVYDPAGAAVAGYLDRVVPPASLEREAAADAARLAELPRRAFAETKRRVRGAVVERARAALQDDMGTWGGSA
jgi:enoyl-CoA hydratase